MSAASTGDHRACCEEYFLLKVESVDRSPMPRTRAASSRSAQARAAAAHDRRHPAPPESSSESARLATIERRQRTAAPSHITRTPSERWRATLRAIPQRAGSRSGSERPNENGDTERRIDAVCGHSRCARQPGRALGLVSHLVCAHSAHPDAAPHAPPRNNKEVERSARLVIFAAHPKFLQLAIGYCCCCREAIERI